jgi:hypothetical protein
MFASTCLLQVERGEYQKTIWLADNISVNATVFL